MAQHQQLNVFHMQAAAAANKRTEQSPNSEVEKREDHAADPPSPRPEERRHQFWRPSACDGSAGPRRRSPPSSDEVGLVDDGARLAAADADEDAFVQPVERGRGRLDPGRGAERVFGCVDVLTARETCEYFGAAVTDAA